MSLTQLPMSPFFCALILLSTIRIAENELRLLERNLKLFPTRFTQKNETTVPSTCQRSFHIAVVGKDTFLFLCEDFFIYYFSSAFLSFSSKLMSKVAAW